VFWRMLLVSTERRGIAKQQLCLASERDSWIEEEQRKSLVIKEETLKSSSLSKEYQVRGVSIFCFNDIICNCVLYWYMKVFSWIKFLYRLTSWCLSYVVLERVCVCLWFLLYWVLFVTQSQSLLWLSWFFFLAFVTQSLQWLSWFFFLAWWDV